VRHIYSLIKASHLALVLSFRRRVSQLSIIVTKYLRKIKLKEEIFIFGWPIAFGPLVKLNIVGGALAGERKREKERD
jgi:hypothetical protein